MPHLVWLDQAMEDLEEAYLFLAEKNIEAAIAAAKAIRDKSSLLEKFPNAGRPAKDLEPEHRELIIPFGVTGYVILYRIEGEDIYILRLRHQKEAGF